MKESRLGYLWNICISQINILTILVSSSHYCINHLIFLFVCTDSGWLKQRIRWHHIPVCQIPEDLKNVCHYHQIASCAKFRPDHPAAAMSVSLCRKAFGIYYEYLLRFVQWSILVNANKGTNKKIDLHLSSQKRSRASLEKPEFEIMTAN